MTHAYVRQPFRLPAAQAVVDAAEALAGRPIASLFDADPARFATSRIDVGPLLFDFSKTHDDPRLRRLGAALWSAAGWPQAIAALVGGGIVNPTEKRPALHTAARLFRAPEVAADGSAIAGALAESEARLQAAVARLRAADSGYDALIHIGIGGSVLGPALVVDALKVGRPERFVTRFLSNVDAHAFEAAIAGLDPARTLLIACSKTWTTLEMQANLTLALDWKRAAGVCEPMTDVVAATAKPELAAKQGVPEANILPFGAWVGGRYSLWSAVGLPIALNLGWEVFAELRAGARAMDAHAVDAAPDENAVLVSALMGFLYAWVWGRATRGVFAYDQRLALLAPFLQQLELESNGKRVDAYGEAYQGPPMPVVWGSVGTDAQHAVFQWLHQSTDWCPMEFIAVRQPEHGHAKAHEALLANCLAQSAALMRGRAEGVEPAQMSLGERPSITILIDRLTPHALGALLAYYEHRTFAIAVLMGINCFDQMGVELGKIMARDLEAPMAGAALPEGWDGSTAGLLRALKG